LRRKIGLYALKNPLQQSDLKLSESDQFSSALRASKRLASELEWSFEIIITQRLRLQRTAR
jgi:hypothetical protein